jgi:hypothetical protein
MAVVFRAVLTPDGSYEIDRAPLGAGVIESLALRVERAGYESLADVIDMGQEPPRTPILERIRINDPEDGEYYVSWES